MTHLSSALENASFLKIASERSGEASRKSGARSRNWRWGSRTFFVAFLFALVGGDGLALDFMSHSLPEDKQAYVGRWHGQGVELELTPEGKVRYVTRRGSTSKSMFAQLRKFEGDHFEAGVWILAKNFEVSEPPAYRNGRWSMTVNGVRLLRSRQPAFAAR